MKMLYKKLQLNESDLRNEINLSKIDEELEEDNEGTGALMCEPYYFKFLYNLESRKKSRNGQKNKFLGTVTIEGKEYITVEEEELKSSMKILEEIVYTNLRRGDVLSKWNENQLVSLLYDVEEDNLKIVANRLQKKFQEKSKNKNITLKIRFKSL